jgi:hypothetical protein
VFHLPLNHLSFDKDGSTFRFRLQTFRNNLDIEIKYKYAVMLVTQTISTKMNLSSRGFVVVELYSPFIWTTLPFDTGSFTKGSIPMQGGTDSIFIHSECAGSAIKKHGRRRT